MGESDYLCRDGQGWVGLGTVVRVDNGVVEISHDGRVKTAGLQTFYHAPTSWPPLEDDILDTYEELAIFKIVPPRIRRIKQNSFQ